MSNQVGTGRSIRMLLIVNNGASSPPVVVDSMIGILVTHTLWGGCLGIILDSIWGQGLVLVEGLVGLGGWQGPSFIPP